MEIQPDQSNASIPRRKRRPAAPPRPTAAAEKGKKDARVAKQALRESERRFRALLEAVPEPLVIVDAQGQIVLVNAETEKVFGYKRAELVGRPVELLLPKRSRHDHIKLRAQFALTPHKRPMGIGMELAGRRKNGAEFPAEISLSPVQTGEGLWVITTVRDVTERKQAEQALRASEERFRLAVDNFPGGLVLYDAERRFQFVNAYVVQSTRTPEEKQLGRTDEELFPNQVTESYLPALRRAIKTKTPQTTESAFTSPSGPVVLAVRYIPVLDEQGHVSEVLGITEDITERKRAEQALEEQAARLQEQANLLELAHDAIIVRDLEGRILFWNRGAQETYGWSREEALGQIAYSLLQAQFPGPIDDVHDQLLADGRWEGELAHTTRDGRQILVASRWVLERDADGQPRAILEINRDDTERIQTRKAFQESAERLRRLTHQVISLQEEERQRISRELHDDSAQALTAAKMSLESVEADLPLGFESLRRRVRESALVIGQTMDKIRALAQDLRPVALDRLGLHHALEGYCRDLTRRTGLPIHYAGVETGDAPETITISLYRFTQEALSNAVKHAHAHHVHVQLQKEHNVVSLCIEDDGQGFDPSTISSAQGASGLGLIGMRERIQLLGGTLDVQSQQGQGTRLTARVPILSQ
ncbi:MAG: PAS domain S-box protein [Chloroflexi bacterium]|nr:PAS domain S-box protein [Chloroflexota bacterium]